MPVIERVDDLSLELMTIEVSTADVYTLEGVPVTVDGVAQVKVGSDEISIATAAERFLSKSQAEVSTWRTKRWRVTCAPSWARCRSKRYTETAMPLPNRCRRSPPTTCATWA